MSQFESGWVVSAVNDMSGKGQGPAGNGWKIKKEQYYSFFKHIGELLIVQELTTERNWNSSKKKGLLVGCWRWFAYLIEGTTWPWNPP